MRERPKQRRTFMRGVMWIKNWESWVKDLFLVQPTPWNSTYITQLATCRDTSAKGREALTELPGSILGWQQEGMGLGKAGRGRGEWKKCSNQTKYSSVFKFLSTMSWSWNIWLFLTPFKLYSLLPTVPVEPWPSYPDLPQAGLEKAPEREALWPSLSSPTSTCISR